MYKGGIIMKTKRRLQERKIILPLLLFFIILVGGSFSLKVEASGTKTNPKIFEFGKQITGTINDYNDVWYMFTLSEKTVLTGTYQSNGNTFYLCDVNGNIIRKLTTSVSANTEKISEVLETGTYKICIGASSYSKNYTVRIDKQSFSWGTINVNWDISNLSAPCTIPVEVTLAGATEGVRIYRVGGEQGLSGTTYSGQIRVSSAGEYNLGIELVYNRDNSSMTKEFSYRVKPEQPNLSLSNVIIGTNYITVRDTAEYNGVVNYLQIYENGNWITKANSLAATGTMTAWGLKADSVYKIRMIKCYSKDGKQLWGTPSKVYTVYTATNKKPGIKSVKAYNFKKKYIKKYWVVGHYDRGRKIWISGHWEGGYYATTYKLKVTLKKKVPGINSKYIDINGKLCKVKGKTYIVSGSYKGKRRKKKITVTASVVKDTYGANGAMAKKKVTI